MEIKSYTVGPFVENTYLLIQDNEALIVDPGFFDPRELKQCISDMKEEGVIPVAVFLTHAHVDHILGLNRVLSEFNIPVYLNHSDLHLWNNFPDQVRRFGFQAPGFDFTPEPLTEGEGFTIGSFTFDVLYTPGHSPDHVSLYLPGQKTVIAGDALFRESIGRTDLYKGDMELLAQSIRTKLYTLPDDTNVLPGHGPSTTIGHEKKNNPFVKGQV